MNNNLEKYTDRKLLKRIEQRGLRGWQFACERPGIYETKFFNDKKYGGTEGAYLAAIKHRNEFLEAASELGVIDRKTGTKRVILIDLKLAPNNTSGIIGVCRSISNREDRKTPEITWRAGYKNEAGENRQKGYSVAQLGEKLALSKAVTFRRDYAKSLLPSVSDDEYHDKLKAHIEELDSILEYISSLNDEADVFFFLGTLNNPNLDQTSKRQMLDVRVGQSRFRKLVMGYWNNRCAVTGSRFFVNAGHIKPWKDSDNFERLDVFNGLALSPLYDRAFDNGYISFCKDGNIIISPKFGAEASLLGVSQEAKIVGLNFLHQKYLEWHRNNIFLKA